MKNLLLLITATLFAGHSLYAQWSDYQPAELVIGQPDFSTNLMATTSSGLSGPYSVAIDFQHLKIYIGDADNHRVLRYSYPVAGNQPVAEIVFGQPDFTSDSAQLFFNGFGYWPDPDARQVLYPMAMAIHNGDLWVVDEYNDRVVRYSQAYNISMNNPSADLVIGQPDFVTRNVGCSDTSFHATWGMTVDTNGNLWVADAGNDRVLRFDNVATLTNGAAASGVLGQTDFTTSSIPAQPTQNQLGMPSSVWVDGTTLWVCDRQFSRVLRFDNATSKANGANADAVLGQPDFVSGAASISQNTLNTPFGICSDQLGNLYVTDCNNDRVLIFLHAVNKANGANADHVLGQGGFNTNYSHYGDQSFAGSSVSGLAIDNTNGKLFVVDRRGMRVMQFAATGPLTGTGNELKLNDVTELISAPNPFSSTTWFQFCTRQAGPVTLKIYNSLGSEVAMPVNEILQAGNHKIAWDADDLAGGIYFCRFTSLNNYPEILKVTLAK